jgi:hypothetical protein
VLPASQKIKKGAKKLPDPGSVSISDSALLDIVERQTFQYFYEVRNL